MTGGWTGSLTIVATAGGLVGSNTCAVVILIDSQTGGNFSGTMTISEGSATSCAQSGTLTGSIATSGQADFGVNIALGTTLPCVRLTGDGRFRGTRSGNNLTVQASETLRCTLGNATQDAARTMTMTLNKQ